VCNAALAALLQTHFIGLRSGSQGQTGLLSFATGRIEMIMLGQRDEIMIRCLAGS
jgi:hypothetical protein